MRVRDSVPRACLLFDLDLTLMRSSGAGLAAMRRAFAAHPGAVEALRGIDAVGRTDGWILSEVHRRCGADEDSLLRWYHDDYPPRLREELSEREVYALPGVRELLAALAPRPDVTIGLATGNSRAAAFAKLECAGLAGFFDRGGFGDRHLGRTPMLREAVASVEWSEGERLVVVGDTERDIESAHEVGALSVGVATGQRTLEQLAAAGAHAALSDFSDLSAALRALLGDRE